MAIFLVSILKNFRTSFLKEWASMYRLLFICFLLKFSSDLSELHDMFNYVNFFEVLSAATRHDTLFPVLAQTATLKAFR